MTIFGKKLLFKKIKLDFNFYFDTYYNMEGCHTTSNEVCSIEKVVPKLKLARSAIHYKGNRTLQTERSLGIYGESQAFGWYREIWLNVTILIPSYIYYQIDLTISGSWWNGNYQHQGIIILWINQFQLSHGAIWVWYSFLQLQT